MITIRTSSSVRMSDCDHICTSHGVRISYYDHNPYDELLCDYKPSDVKMCSRDHIPYIVRCHVELL